MIPLGIRINNPGNLRSVPGVNWVGQSGEQEGFCVFSSALLGIRALAIDLYNANLRFKSVALMVAHYAPPNENNTAAYINNLCAFLDVQPDDTIFLSNQSFAALYIRGVIVQEQGYMDPPVETEWFAPSVISGAMLQADKWGGDVA